MQQEIIDITINPAAIEELEAALGDAIDALMSLHTIVKRDNDKKKHDAAFIRYCFTGRYE